MLSMYKNSDINYILPEKDNINYNGGKFMITKRKSTISAAVTRLIPQAPFYDAEAIRTQAAAKHLRNITAETAVWLTIVAYIRHVYTNYDTLRDEGYERDAARFFVHSAINDKLLQWRATRFLNIEDHAEESSAMEDSAKEPLPQKMKRAAQAAPSNKDKPA